MHYLNYALTSIGWDSLDLASRRAGGKHILALRAEKIVRAVRRDKKSKLSKPLLPSLVGIVRSTGTYTI